MSQTITRVMEVRLFIVQRDEQRALEPCVMAVLDRLNEAPGVYAAGWKVERNWRQATNDALSESEALVRRELGL